MSRKRTVFAAIKDKVNGICAYKRLGGWRLALAAEGDNLFRTGKKAEALKRAMLSAPLEKIAEFHKWQYESSTGETLDYFHPKNFPQKLQQVLIYDALPIKTRLADKILMKEYVAQKIGDGSTPKTYGVWESFDEIDFDSLPDKFALKTNHASKTNYLVPDKSALDTADARKCFEKWMGINYGATEFCELHYKDIHPYIFAEEYLSSSRGVIYNYSILCILGEPEAIRIVEDTGDKSRKRQAVYDAAGNRLYMKGFDADCVEADIPVPENIGELFDIARKLSTDADLVRVDLYGVDGKIYVSELTFTPCACKFGAVRYPSNWTFLSPRAAGWICAPPKNIPRDGE